MQEVEMDREKKGEEIDYRRYGEIFRWDKDGKIRFGRVISIDRQLGELEEEKRKRKARSARVRAIETKGENATLETASERELRGARARRLVGSSRSTSRSTTSGASFVSTAQDRLRTRHPLTGRHHRTH